MVRVQVTSFDQRSLEVQFSKSLLGFSSLPHRGAIQWPAQVLHSLQILKVFRVRSMYVQLGGNPGIPEQLEVVPFLSSSLSVIAPVGIDSPGLFFEVLLPES